MKELERVLGIDPGITDMGYGVIEINHNTKKLSYITCGMINTSPKSSLSKRLNFIKTAYNEVVSEYNPSVTCIEEYFFIKKFSLGGHTSKVIGVVASEAHGWNMPCYAFSPQTVKNISIGKRDKEGVEAGVRALLDNPTIKQSKSHPYDALAIALCYAQGFNFDWK